MSPAAGLSIVQVTPHRRATRNPVNEYVGRVSEELRRRGHEVLVLGSGDGVKRRLAADEFDIVHVHDPFAPRISSAALRHSHSLNVATFHAPQERVLSTQVARPLVEIFFGRLDARTVATAATGELLERYFPGPYELVEAAGKGRDWEAVAAELEAIYRRIAGRRHDGSGDAEARRRIAGRPLIEVDLHMHTDHSPDCATPVEVLLETARDRGLGAIAITDHNEVSGALEARRIAEQMGDIKVIVAEEVKTAEQGEVIGLFLEEKIPRGMSMSETIAEIRRQGGLVYVPHPFDRFHSVPDYEHLLDIVEEIDVLEVFNPRVAVTAFNEEAERFAGKYRIVPGAGSDSHVAQGLGSVRVRIHDFEGPAEFLEAMRDADITRKHKNLVYVQALKLLQTTGRPKAAKRSVPDAKPVRGGEAAAQALGQQELMQARAAKGAAAEPSKMSPTVPATDDEIREKYLERAIRELNQLTHELQDCPHCPRGKLMPVLGSGHPQADVFMVKHSPGVAEIEEGVAFYGRPGNALMKSFRRLGIDPLVVYGTLCVKCPIAEPDLAPEECVRRIVEEFAVVQPKIMVIMGEPALRVVNRLEIPLSRQIEPRMGEIQAFTPTVDALYTPDIDESLDEEGAKQRFWRSFKILGEWYEDLPPY